MEYRAAHGLAFLAALTLAEPGNGQTPAPPPTPVPQFGLPVPTVFTSKIGFFTPDRIAGAS